MTRATRVMIEFWLNEIILDLDNDCNLKLKTGFKLLFELWFVASQHFIRLGMTSQTASRHARERESMFV